ICRRSKRALWWGHFRCRRGPAGGLSWAQKPPIGFVAICNLIEVTEVGQESFKSGIVGLGYLEGGQHPPGVAAVVAIMEETDVPPPAERVQELQQRPGTFGKLEPAETFT